MKILSRKNGVALIAVLTVLLVLTLLLPVMFKTTENATYSAATELSRQRAGYLARTGAEMAVATLKSTLKDESFEPFYTALKKEKDANGKPVENSKYGIKAVNGYLQAEMEPISLYYKPDSSEESGYKSIYISGTPDAAEISGCEFIGKTEITITYNGDPEYFEVKDGKYIESDVNTATTAVTSNGSPVTDKNGKPVREIKEGYIVIYNDNYMVKSTATVKGQKATRSAAVMETRDMLNEKDNNDSFVAYTEQYWSLAPDFVKIIEGDYPTPKDGYTKNDGTPEKNYSYGGNHVLPNPFMATSKKTIKAFGEGMTGENVVGNYYNKDIYIYSTIGNMNINLPDGREYVTVIDHGGGKGGNVMNYMALGAYPGLNWRVFENTKSEHQPSLQGVNYNAYSDTVQRYNFVSFCATDTLQVSLPIELRVNPKRSSRGGDNPLLGEDNNATLFKVMNFQAKDIVFDKRIDLFTSICIREFNGYLKEDCEVRAFRGGFLNLIAPANTPYSYYNKDRDPAGNPKTSSGGEGKTVKAGIVYFHKPVYLWFQNYDALGTDTSLRSHNYSLTGETMFRTGIVTDNTIFTEEYSGTGIMTANNVTDDLIVFKVFDEGDVYYFNSEIMGEVDGEKQNIGVNIANWFLETKYLPAREKEENTIWDYFFDFRETLYIDYIVNNQKTYVEDDMHYIGNMNDDPTLMAPEIEDELYVIWDN